MLSPGDHRRSLQCGERTRTYLIHVPPGFDPAQPVPVVLVFHGGATNARTMARFCGLNETADRYGFLAVYPSGTGRNPNLLTWNAGNCCGDALRDKVDDVGFVAALLDDLAGLAEIDPNRVFATGMSNGGMLAYRLALELSERIAAIASIAGPMGTDGCRPTRPVSILHFHGTADEFTPYAGGLGPKSLTTIVFRSAADSVRWWVAANGCPERPQESTIDAEETGGFPVERSVWGPGDSASEVVLYTIHGGGHTWPGRIPSGTYLGPSATGISANELLWAFFQRHAR
jgi:polyhydroxybutyrate depolymerase